MPNGFGRGRGFGRGFGRGMGYGFRGSLPPWPYTGRGRGWLPRYGYFLDNAPGEAFIGVDYQQPAYAYNEGALPMPQATQEQGFDSLRNQADALREQLEHVESRIRDLQ